MDVQTAHVEQNNRHFEFYTITTKMPKRKKSTVLDESILNYSKYEYSDSLEHFSEHDRLTVGE